MSGGPNCSARSGNTKPKHKDYKQQVVEKLHQSFLVKVPVVGGCHGAFVERLRNTTLKLYLMCQTLSRGVRVCVCERIVLTHITHFLCSLPAAEHY